MENKIDQFFRNKLESHTRTPSEEAWTKVEATLSKKNNAVAWRIAAALLVAGALLSAIIWSQQGAIKNPPENFAHQPTPKPGKEKRSPQLSLQKKEGQINSTHKAQRSLPVESGPAGKPESQKKTQSPQVALSTSSPAENKSDANKKQVMTTQPTVETLTVAGIEEKNKPENANEYATLSTAVASTRQKPIKLEFTLEDFSSEQPVAKVSDEKSTRLKKVWELAREVKNGDGPVREMKNELFALSFRKNKNQ